MSCCHHRRSIRGGHSTPAPSLLVVVVVVGLAWIVADCRADVYLHNPKGSNNRQAEESADRQNGNRLFDSQNNNRGGYNSNSLYYYVGSVLPIELTAQHGFANPRMNGQIIIQYMCERWNPGVRDGTRTDTIPDDPVQSKLVEFGQHETYEYFQDCKVRERNYGLFTADQLDSSVKNSQRDARFTRQSNAAQRFGFECSEERDYYPYWHPTPWKDIAVYTTNTSQCSMYLAESQNVREKGKCNVPRFNTPSSCVAGGGNWTTVAAWGALPPLCLSGPFSRDNHLGNVGDGSGEPFTHRWVIPDDVSDNCVLRVRYNISTGEVPWDVDARWNRNLTVGVYQVPTDTSAAGDITNTTEKRVFLRTNPVVNFGIPGVNLRMAVNSDQYGRTFQDRSHVFRIVARPADVPASALIYNLNIRGRRGNIVQVFPAVEYDFVPNTLETAVGDRVHLQWSGSNTSPAGAGEGKENTDRSNFMQMRDLNENFPIPVSELGKISAATPLTAGSGSTVPYSSDLTTVRRLALLGDPNGQFGGDTATLDDAGTYFDGGLLEMKQTGTMAYMSTRNNNFSNRSQKGLIRVIPTNRLTVRVQGNCTSFTPQQGVEWLAQFAKSVGVPADRLQIVQWGCGSVVMQVAVNPPGPANVDATTTGSSSSATNANSTWNMLLKYQTVAQNDPSTLSALGVLDATTLDGQVLTIRTMDTGSIAGSVAGAVGAFVVLVGVAVMYLRNHPEVLPRWMTSRKSRGAGGGAGGGGGGGDAGKSGHGLPIGDGNELSFFRKYGKLEETEEEGAFEMSAVSAVEIEAPNTTVSTSGMKDVRIGGSSSSSKSPVLTAVGTAHSASLPASSSASSSVSVSIPPPKRAPPPSVAGSRFSDKL